MERVFRELRGIDIIAESVETHFVQIVPHQEYILPKSHQYVFLSLSLEFITHTHTHTHTQPFGRVKARRVCDTCLVDTKLQLEPVAMIRSEDVVIMGTSVKNSKIDEVTHQKISSEEKRPPLFFDGATKKNYLAVLVRSWERLCKHRPEVADAAEKVRNRVAVLYARDILSVHKGLLSNSIVITARIGTKRGSSGNFETQIKEGSVKFSRFKDALQWRSTLLRLSALEDKKNDSCLVFIPPDLATSRDGGVGVGSNQEAGELTYVLSLSLSLSNLSMYFFDYHHHHHQQQ